MKSFLKCCTALTVALAFAGQAAAQEPLKELGKGEGALSIVAWPGYIERGESDKAYDWVTDFEKQTGCKVTVKTAATSDEMVALMNEGGFDLVTASGDSSLRMVAGKRVQPINTDLIPSWKTVDKRLQDAPWFTVDGVHYGVPYQWGPNVLMYNTNVFKEAPKSWNVVFEPMDFPDGKPNKGRVQAYDGPIHIADAANYLMAHKPELGIKDPYELNEDQYKAALDLLRTGGLDGLSIGFRTVKARKDARTGLRHIVEADLWEISLVTFPMLPEARIASVKARGTFAGDRAVPGAPPDGRLAARRDETGLARLMRAAARKIVR